MQKRVSAVNRALVVRHDNESTARPVRQLRAHAPQLKVVFEVDGLGANSAIDNVSSSAARKIPG
jgi:hypothetical protein